MIISATILKAVAKALSDDDHRYALNYAQVREDGTVVATNGHWAILAKDKSPTPDEDFPSAGMPEERKPISKPTLIGASLIQKLLKAMPTGKRAMPITKTVLLAERENGVRYAAATDLETQLVAEVTDSGLTFPNVDRVLVPDDRPHITVRLSAKYLKALAEVAMLFDENGSASVAFEIPTEAKHRTKVAATDEHGARVQDESGRVKMVATDELVDQVRFTVNATEHDVHGVLMPMRQ